MSKYFHFTIGPVQGFVWQARRTKDFWAGSFLLSYLSGVAMAATQAQGGKIVFPVPQEEFLSAIKTGQKNPTHGDVPNRFKAEVPNDFDTSKVVNAVQIVWESLAQAVWGNDFADSDKLGATKTVWDRQIKNFWEISWAMTDNPSESNALDRRKNWRSHIQPPEPGFKCSIMAGWQELSGENEYAKVKAFWSSLSDKFDLDIKDGEQLCAPAFIKRRFSKYFNKLKVSFDNQTYHGWSLNTNVPSVALLAAMPWLANVIKTCEEEKVRDLAEACDEASSKGASLIELQMLNDALKDKMVDEVIKSKLLHIDGMTLFEEFLDNKNLFDSEKASAVKHAIKNLSAKDKPSPFYAIIQMDGDKFGEHMSDVNKQTAISNSLNLFISKVKGIVDSHSGFLIYAGGEDVQAIMPLETALACVLKLRTAFESAMTDGGARNAGVDGTISAGVLFAHVKTPLHSVLSKAFDLLYDVAKDKAGRDAIAIQIVKPGGINNTWTQPWNIAAVDSKLKIQDLADEYAKQLENKQYSSGFFYRIREIMDLLADIGTDGDKISILAAEYRTGTNLTQQQAVEIITPLLEQCTPVVREVGKKQEEWMKKPIEAEVAMIMRFLAQKGVEL